jgi:hypothetical protein
VSDKTFLERNDSRNVVFSQRFKNGVEGRGGWS